MSNVVIRVDSSSQIGMGHFTRSTALANEFAEQGHAVFLVTSKNSIIPDYAKQVYKKVWFVDNEWDINSEKVIIEEIVRLIDIDVMVVDTYRANQEYYYNLVKYSRILVVFDDIGEKEGPFNILINGNIYAKKLKYNFCTHNLLLLLGSKYLILRPEFKVVKPIQINKEVKKVLITFGGSDVLNATPDILNAICCCSKLNKNVQLVTLIGPGYTNVDKIKQLSDSCSNIKLVHNPDSIGSILAEVDIAVSAAGSGTYEIACMGIPSILFVVADNQVKVAQTMQETGMSINLGNFSSFNSKQFIETYDELVINFSMRKKMHDKAIRNFDALGAERCAIDIIKYLEK